MIKYEQMLQGVTVHSENYAMQIQTIIESLSQNDNITPEQAIILFAL